jgi:hypothetical protein
MNVRALCLGGGVCPGGGQRGDEAAHPGPGFLDGEAISQCKEQYGIDILIPIRRNMDLYADAMALFQDSEVQWVECKGAGQAG